MKDEWSQKDTDDIMTPSHYNQAGIECLDVQMATSDPEVFKEHARLTALKYVYRANYKGNREKDLRKAIFYLHLAVGDEPREDRKTESWVAKYEE